MFTSEIGTIHNNSAIAAYSTYVRYGPEDSAMTWLDKGWLSVGPSG
jgi:hypothetical protein